MKSLILAASEKVNVNEVTKIKDLYPNAMIFHTTDEFEQYVLDGAIEYLVDNYSDNEEYSSDTWMFLTAFADDDEWIFHFNKEYFIMDYQNGDNDKAEDVQVAIWEKHIDEIANRLAEVLETETKVETSAYYSQGQEQKNSVIKVSDVVDEDNQYIQK